MKEFEEKTSMICGAKTCVHFNTLHISNCELENIAISDVEDGVKCLSYQISEELEIFE